ncbi:hypothetical protein ACFQZE_14420 [Paenibacillus sp. GCM10027627]|uniref:hypothetical protein n=1 Tax=unclassified Paenibacillus TaxID=185978 RepID=UPI003638375B
MTIIAKYAKEMNEIKASDELKQSIISKSNINSSTAQTKAQSFRNKTAMISAACVIVFLLVFGGSLFLNDGNHTGDSHSTLFNGFVITAYATDGTPFMVKPEVDFPLGQYSPLMSSVPGFPIKVVSTDTDQISLRASDGQLLFWNPADSKVINQGKEAIVKPGDIIYWSPIVAGEHGHAAEEAELEITAYKDKKKIGSSKIEIKTEGNGWYKGKATDH